MARHSLRITRRGINNEGAKKITNCYHPHLNAPDTVFSSKFTSVFKPADAWHGAAHGWTTKLHCVPSRNSIKLLLHTLGVGPIGTCINKD